MDSSMARSSMRFLNTEKWTDCSFLVGNTKNTKLIKAHKLFLGSASTVFEEMLLGKLAEKTFPVKIPDSTPEHFTAMLKYIYSRDLTFIIGNDATFEKACGLYYLADKYMLPDEVTKACVDCLNKMVNCNNACSSYQFGDLHNIPSIKESAIKIIRAESNAVFLSSDFVECEFSTLMFILNMEGIQNSTEIDFFNAVDRYFSSRSINDETNQVESNDENGDYKENPNDIKSSVQDAKKQTIKLSEDDENNLKKAIQKIRFLSLTPKEFVEGPAKSWVLQEREIYEIMIALNQSYVVQGSYPRKFSTSKINRKTIKTEQTLCCNNCSSRNISYR